MKKLLLVLIAGVTLFVSPAFGMTITPFDTANKLAQHLVGSGVTVSNVTYTGANVASGYFSDGMAAGIGIESGIVLTSGYASHLNGITNTSDGITGNNGLAGDPDLTALIPGYSTLDATVLEFDFISQGPAAYFQYVFGSEEYNEYVGSLYNDVFGFFSNSGPNGAIINVALIPGTSTPVSINNVNNGYALNSWPATNPSYYNDNDSNNAFAFEYDGFTDVFTAVITGLTAGEIYHLKLAIADAGDRILDSGVFLKAGSFSEDDPDNPVVPEPATMVLFGLGLLGLAGVSRKK